MHAALALPFLNHFADLSRVSASALIAAIWQGALLAAAAALALRAVPRIPAAARFAIWFAVFALIAALPFLGLFDVTRHAAAIASGATAHPWLTLDSRWTLAIAAIWSVASLVRVATLMAAALRVRSLSRNATPLQSSSGAITGATRKAQLCASADIDRPTVIGFFSPKILIPAWLLKGLTPAELEHIVLHEAGHLNRADDWLNLLQKIALVIFPLNPALAWVERRLCFERELACDERVLAMLAACDSHGAASYASSLTTVAEYRLQHRGVIRAAQNLALGALGRESELGRRVARILRPAARMRPLHVRIATTAAITALLFAATELEHTPQLISFTSPAPSVQLAGAASSRPALLPGYRAVAARMVLSDAQPVTPIGDGSPQFASIRTDSVRPAFAHAAPAARPAIRETQVHLRVSPGRTPAPQMAADRDGDSGNAFIVTRWTVSQSSDGYRVVRTTAVFSNAHAEQSATASDFDSQDSAASHLHGPRLRQIAQPVSPYAAVPVPGGWLVIQL